MSTHKHPNQAPAHPNLQHTLKHRCDKNPAFHVATPPHTTIFSNKTAPLLHVSQDSCTIATQSPAAPSLPDTTHSRAQNRILSGTAPSKTTLFCGHPSSKPLSSMKQGTFMDKHTKTLPSSMKQADLMDNSTKIPHPSMKQGISMDKSQDPGSTGTKQAEQPPAELRRLL